MKVLLKLMVISIGLITFSGFTHSSGYLNPLGTGVKIDKVHVLGNGGTVVWLSTAVPKNPDSCQRANMVYIPHDLRQYNQMVSMLIAAHAQNKPVGFWSSGCTTNYFWGPDVTFPKIRDLWVNQ